MTTDALCYYGSYNIYYSAWADYINGSISGIALLNFESTVVVSLCVVVGCGWPLNHPRNISAVKPESEP